MRICGPMRIGEMAIPNGDPTGPVEDPSGSGSIGYPSAPVGDPTGPVWLRLALHKTVLNTKIYRRLNGMGLDPSQTTTTTLAPGGVNKNRPGKDESAMESKSI